MQAVCLFGGHALRDRDGDSCPTGGVSPRPFRSVSTIAAVRGTLQLGVAGTLAITTLAEAVHLAVLSSTPFGLGRRLTQGIYGGVRTVAGAAGQGSDALLALAERQMSPEAAKRAAVPMPLPLGLQAVLNGIVGDRLVEMGHSAALPMRVRPHAASRPGADAAGADDVLFVHGLCMHDRHWQGDADAGIDVGAALGRALGTRSLYLRYNSGRSIAENGRRLATLLAQRDARSRGRDRPLHIVAHSLGGLVVRSALGSAAARGHAWPHRVANVVFLGTPHEGAPLERAGKVLEALISASRFSAPWAMLARLRSVAIRQLGEADVPAWPDGLTSARVHLVAGCQTRRGPRVAHEHWGDGLVPVASALARSLADDVLPVSSRTVLDGVGHLALLRHPEVAAGLRTVIGEPR